MAIFVIIFGLIIGSFLEAFTSRAPIGESIARGRSRCPKCKSTIQARDNIPLLSFVLLQGKCRSCAKPIPHRAPIIEFTTASLFFLVYQSQPQITANLPWLLNLPTPLITVLLLLATALLLAVLITDFEHQIILDEVVFLGFISTLLALALYSPANLYTHLAAGFGSALFLLILHLVTRGRGMGLGDVKLALFTGSFLGIFSAFIWMFLSFILGAVLGLFLLSLKLKKYGDKIAFGPFLVIAFFVYILFAQYLDQYLIYAWL